MFHSFRALDKLFTALDAAYVDTNMKSSPGSQNRQPGFSNWNNFLSPWSLGTTQAVTVLPELLLLLPYYFFLKPVNHKTH